MTTSLLRLLHQQDDARAVQIARDDPRIRTENVALDTNWGKLDCYIAYPGDDDLRHPAILVAHDKYGRTPHFEDVARRLALEKFVVFVPDYASRFGGTPPERGPAQEVMGMVSTADMVADTRTALKWLKSSDRSTGKIGAVGFGAGATAIDAAVTVLTDLKVAAIFYGHPPPIADVGNIKAQLLLNFAAKDQFISPEIPGLVDALNRAGVKYELFVYDNTERGFDDESDTAHYSAAAADLAWARLIAFFKTTLS